jgi:prepilin-type N-terminal cleavage/methylation domain-containing protein
MKKILLADKYGFTLIELVVVISVLAVIMVTVTNIMVSSFRARSRVDIADKLEQNGNSALAEIRNNIFNSDGRGISCLLGGTIGIGRSIIFTNKHDGKETTLDCHNGSMIASESADSLSLTSEDVIVGGCDTFVSCEPLPSSPDVVSVANFKFVVSTSTMPSVGIAETISRTFETKMVIR